MIWVSVAAGVGVAAASGLSVWLALRWVWARPQFTIPVVLGGMAIRLLGVGVVSILLLLFADLEPMYYAGALIAGLVAIQVVEIAVVLRRAAADRGEGQSS